MENEDGSCLDLWTLGSTCEASATEFDDQLLRNPPKWGPTKLLSVT